MRLLEKKNSEQSQNEKELKLTQEAIVKNLEMLLGNSVEETIELVGMLEKTDQTVDECKSDNNDLRQKL